MQNNWGMQDPDWQLRRLQQDCVRTSDKALAVLFTAVQQEVVMVHDEYEKIFGPNSAQFAEYITLVLQKLNSQGVCSKTCGEWLVAASSGAIPPVHASASFNSQSQTLKQIPEEFRSQLESTLEYSPLPDDAEFESALTSGDGQTWPAQSAAAHETFLPQPGGADLIQEANGFSNPWGDEAIESPSKVSKTGLNSLMPASVEGMSPFAQPDFLPTEPVAQPAVQPVMQPAVQPGVQPGVQPVALNQSASNPWDSFDDNPVVPAPQVAQPSAYGQQISQNNPVIAPAPSPGFANPYGQVPQQAGTWPSPQAAVQAIAPLAQAVVPEQNISGSQPLPQHISQTQVPAAQSPWGTPAPQAFLSPSQVPYPASTQGVPPVVNQPPGNLPAPLPPSPVAPNPAQHQSFGDTYGQQSSQQSMQYAQQVSQSNQIPQSGFQPQDTGSHQAPAYQNQFNQQYNGGGMPAQQQMSQPEPVYANIPSASMSGGWWDNPAEESPQYENQRQDSGPDEKDPNYTYDPATAWD